jgi:Cu(I)/Ag(I) efflux system membrane fusion protein
MTTLREGREPDARPADHPFGKPASGPRRALRITVAAALLLLTVGVVWVLTRGAARAPSAGGHDMATMATTSDSTRPVTLTADAARRIGVTYAVAEVTSLGREIRTVGHVTFDERRVQAIAPKVEGWVERLFVDVTGQPVREGEPLLTIYSPMLVTAQEELLLARRLAADVVQGTDDARRSAEQLLASARRRLEYWGISSTEITRIEESGVVQRTLTLHSTATGVVIERAVLEGQRIMAGEALFKVADLRRVWIEGDVFEQDLAGVRVGQAVEAELEALPGERVSGRISYVYPTLDPETRTARVRAEYANPGLRLKPGMYATLRVQGARTSALSVPRSAVLATGERSIVFVKRADGRLEPRLVRLGLATDERVEVLAGLVAGDTVVASATFLVDAESNLGTALGGMGDMPGMEITTPPATRASPPARTPPPDAHQGHEE